MSNNIRIKTTPGGGDTRLNVKIDQKFDFIEILSLKISQDEAYRRFCSDYGVIVGRVIVNNGLGVPNAKVSVFIPIDEEDAEDPEILGLYPFEVVTDKDSDGIGYNLLPRDGRGKDDCYSVVGTFPSKREIQDNPEMSDIYCKYYKYTTTTNDSGDFMIFGVPVGTHFLHVDADISDIGILSQKPYDLINNGATAKSFKSPSQFKSKKDTANPTQIKTSSPLSVTVVPFWGDTEECEVGITRRDVDLQMDIIPSAIFIGSLVSDNDKHGINKKCRPRRKAGEHEELVTGSGRIEMIRYNVDGAVERFDIEGGNVIDEDGTWAYQIPMNLDYKVTAEDGSLIDSTEPGVGIPTRTRVRFRAGMTTTGAEGRLRTRAKHLIPHNPDNSNDVDYTFDSTTRDKHFTDLHWNKIYTVKSYIPRVQPNKSNENRNFIGFKNIDNGPYNPIPFNKLDNTLPPDAGVLCIILAVIVNGLLLVFNSVVIPLLNIVIAILNIVVGVICTIIFSVNLAICFVKGLIPGGGSNDAECRSAGCIANCSGNCTGPQDCCFGDIIPYIPYIILPCNEEKYAPWAIRYGFPYSNTFNATVYAVNPGQVDEPTGFLGSNALPTSYVNFHYPGDGHLGHDQPDAGWTQCVVADTINMKFDFYNDWMNGTLYSFLLKYKTKKKGKQKFCDVDCDDNNLGVDGDEDGDPDNKCKKNWILDTGTGAFPQNSDNNTNNTNVNTKKFVEIKEGYIKKYEDELYYSAYSKKKGFRLFATDIVSLGSVMDCDWQGIPKIYPYLISSTYNIPPFNTQYVEVDETELVGSEYSNNIDVNGFYNGYNIDNALIGVPSCFGLNTDSQQVNNVKRLCELGMGLDEDRTDSGGLAANNKIGNEDVENPWIRGAFAFVNGISGPNNTIPLIYIDNNNGYPVSITTGYNDIYYAQFRNVSKKTIWEYDNSFYFYFGLHEGKTALDKMMNKYFTPCVITQEFDFFVIATEIIEDDLGPLPTGGISIEVIGGNIASVEWTGPILNGSQFTSTNQNLTDIYAGTYNVTVRDSAGRIAEGTFIVPGPPATTCNVQTTELTQNGSGDGQITLNLNGGVAPYNVVLERWDNVANVSLGVVTATTLTTQSELFDNLDGGYYKVSVDDTGIPQTSCFDIVELEEPSVIGLSVSGVSINCYGDGNGVAYIQVNGGVPPYIVNWSNGVSNSNSITGLGSGTYSVQVIDQAGQSANGSYTVTEPDEVTYLVSETGAGNTGTDGQVIVFNTQGGVPPYTYNLQGGSQNINETQTGTTGDNITFSNLPSGNFLEGNSYTLYVTDSNGCVDARQVNVLGSSTPLNVALTNTGSLYTVNISGGVFDPPTFQYEVRVFDVTAGNWETNWENPNFNDTTHQFDIPTNGFGIPSNNTFRIHVRDNNGNAGYSEVTTDCFNNIQGIIGPC